MKQETPIWTCETRIPSTLHSFSTIVAHRVARIQSLSSRVQVPQYGPEIGEAEFCTAYRIGSETEAVMSNDVACRESVLGQSILDGAHVNAASSQRCISMCVPARSLQTAGVARWRLEDRTRLTLHVQGEMRVNMSPRRQRVHSIRCGSFAEWRLLIHQITIARKVNQ